MSKTREVVSTVVVGLFCLTIAIAVTFLMAWIDRAGAFDKCHQFASETGIETRWMEPHWMGDYYCDVKGVDGQWHKTYMN